MLLILSLLLPVLLVPASGSAQKLSEGIAPTDCLALAAQCAIADGYELDPGSVGRDGDLIFCKVGIFTLSVESRNGTAYSVSVASNYLDADYATSMGRIFGRILAAVGGFTEIDTILSTIDFNVFNTLSPNTQTLIQGDYKLIVKVDPSLDNAYILTLQLINPVANSNDISTPLSAQEILDIMAPDLSASVAYTEETDPNHTLGQQGSYRSKVNFALQSVDPAADAAKGIEVEQGGSVEVFENPLDAINRCQKVMSNKYSVFGSWEYCFVCGTAVLRLSRNLSPEETGALVTSFMKAVLSPAPATASRRQVSVGDTVRFGSYEQDGDAGNGAEPISWLVLAVDGDAALLVSVDALDVYNRDWQSPTWDQSTLRSWLNSDFLNSAFSAAERSFILVGTVRADRNPNYPSDPGSDTEDAVFCLSYPEADSLLTLQQRRAKPSVYAQREKGVYTDGGYCYWWLRSPGKPGCGAAIVCVDGNYDYDVSWDGFSYGVRPCVRVSVGALGK